MKRELLEAILADTVGAHTKKEQLQNPFLVRLMALVATATSADDDIPNIDIINCFLPKMTPEIDLLLRRDTVAKGTANLYAHCMLAIRDLCTTASEFSRLKLQIKKVAHMLSRALPEDVPFFDTWHDNYYSQANFVRLLQEFGMKIPSTYNLSVLDCGVTFLDDAFADQFEALFDPSLQLTEAEEKRLIELEEVSTAALSEADKALISRDRAVLRFPRALALTLSVLTENGKDADQYLVQALEQHRQCEHFLHRHLSHLGDKIPDGLYELVLSLAVYSAFDKEKRATIKFNPIHQSETLYPAQNNNLIAFLCYAAAFVQTTTSHVHNPFAFYHIFFAGSSSYQNFNKIDEVSASADEHWSREKVRAQHVDRDINLGVEQAMQSLKDPRVKAITHFMFFELGGKPVTNGIPANFDRSSGSGGGCGEEEEETFRPGRGAGHPRS